MIDDSTAKMYTSCVLLRWTKCAASAASAANAPSFEKGCYTV